jgi:putative hydrolase of the HAD superfamily
MAIRAVLFDVGGPIDTEAQAERAIDARIVAGFAAEGVAVPPDAFADANRYAVESFAPDAYSTIVWRLADGDAELARRVRAIPFGPRVFELREGIAGVIERLHASGLKLGLAANQPARILGVLDEAGIGRYFSHREVSGHHGYRKPDVRLFLRACEDLGVAPEECIMVGDRIDNDIAPARLLGMRTVLIRTGRHIGQQPRSWEEVADVEVRDAEGIEAAVGAVVSSEARRLSAEFGF